MEKIKKILSRIDGLIERNMESGTSDSYINGWNLGFHFAKEVILREFPELRGSGDERIRKEIINFLRSPFVTENITDEIITPWIAYLEKQKEQKPILTEETELNSIAFLEQLGYTCVPPGAEQKPAQWSEEDEKWIDRACMLLNELNDLSHLTLAKIPSNVDEIIAHIKSLRPKPKSEWSEEDKQHKSWILECLADGERKTPEYAEDFRAAYNWLKSLRSQPYWKPSEDQMDELDNARHNLTASCDVLTSLYEQLKNLI